MNALCILVRGEWWLRQEQAHQYHSERLRRRCLNRAILALPLISFFSTFLIYSPKRALTNSASIFGTSGAGWLMVSAEAVGGTAAGGLAALPRV